jgi:hypothetical protein
MRAITREELRANGDWQAADASAAGLALAAQSRPFCSSVGG